VILFEQFGKQLGTFQMDGLLVAEKECIAIEVAAGVDEGRYPRKNQVA
jgi:hypothetical protein